MTQDFAKYSKIIENFRGEVSDKNFETQFLAATQHIPKTDRFLLKMELKRLAQPCTRLIDLRGLVDGECKSFGHDGRIHFLDDLAIATYEEYFNAYKAYTMGVYEAVKNTENNFRVIYQRQKAKDALPTDSPKPPTVLEKLQYPAKLMNFGPYFNRQEERMNFAIAIEIILSNEQVIECTSSDISVNGCKFRLTQVQNFTLGQEITLRFKGLEQEFHFGENHNFTYQIRNIKIVDDIQLVGVERIYPNNLTEDAFSRFLTGFIQGNKRRYKINLDNSIKALQSRIVEQYSLPKVNELPVFIEKVQEQLLPRYALTCQNNQGIFEYWTDERKYSTLHYLFTPDRIEQLLKARKLGKSLLVYSFVHHSQDKQYFYSADEKQLSEDLDFMVEFLGFAAAKSSFAIFDLSLLDVNANFAHSAFTLSDSIEVKDTYLNELPSDEVKDIVKQLAYIGVVTEVTNIELIKQYQNFNYENIQVNRIRAFGHKRLTEPMPVDRLGITYHNLRQEPRFIYNTDVVVSAQKVEWVGRSLDFSVSGLKIELNKPAVLMKGDIVNLTFPSLQKITSSFDLTGLPYEIVRVNKAKTIINLRVYVAQHKHIGRAFFKLLIEKNKHKLTPDEYIMMVPGLAKALRNIYSQSLTLPNVVVQTSGSRYKFETIASNTANNRLLSVMKDLSDKPGLYNLYPILHNLKVSDIISSHLKKSMVDTVAISEVIYVLVDPNKEKVIQAVITKWAHEFSTPEQVNFFIKNAMKKGLFFCIEIKISRTSNADLKYLTPELNYIASYAIHRGKQLEQEIYSVAGMVQLVDITAEAKVRYKLNQHLLEAVKHEERI